MIVVPSRLDSLLSTLAPSQVTRGLLVAATLLTATAACSSPKCKGAACGTYEGGNEPSAPSGAGGGNGSGGTSSTGSPCGTTPWMHRGDGLKNACVSALAWSPASPTSLWLVAHGTIFRSINEGASWSQTGKLDYAFAKYMVADPFDPAIVVIGGCDGLYRTTDGMSFAHTMTSPACVQAMAAHPARPGVMFMAMPGASGGLWRSYDHGDTWTNLAAPLVSAIAFPPGEPSTVLVGSGKGLLRSTDDGESWASTVELATQQAASLQSRSTRATLRSSTRPRRWWCCAATTAARRGTRC